MPTKSVYAVQNTNNTVLEAGTANKVKSIVFVPYASSGTWTLDIKMGSTQYICKNLKVLGGSTLIIDDPSLLTYDTQVDDLIVYFAASSTAYITVNYT
jgi:hypothetical protein